MLSLENVLAIHEILVRKFQDSEDPISPPGIKNRDLLESAVGRPEQTIGGKDAYETPFDKAAALFHSLINNHAFHNGNKRIALVSAQALLAQYSQWLEISSDDEMLEFTKNAASHKITNDRADELNYISEWFEANSRKAIKGEYPLKYSELKKILSNFGFEIDPPDNNLLYIYKEGKKIERIIKQGIQGFRPYHTDYIAGLRKRLGLTTENGVDSALFYGHKGVAADDAAAFIDLRIEVMKALAKI